MTNYISRLAFTLLGCTALLSCADNDYTQLDKGHDTLSLTASANTIVLNEEAHNSDALQLSWTTGTNYGTGNRISYTLEIAESGTNFAVPYTVLKDATQTYTWTGSVEELNTILLNHFGLNGSETLSLDARVTATVSGNEEQQSALTSFSVTGYQPLTTTLYLIGDATSGGWNADEATEMTRTDNGIFTWTGALTAGNFKFITTMGSLLPSYNKGNDGNLVLRTSESDPDETFDVEESDTYQVNVNLFTGVMTLTVSQGETPAYDQLYLVGDMNNWGFTPMKQDALDPFLFRYGGVFETEGEFKFGTSNGSWENMYKAQNANAPYTDSAMEFVKGYDPDNKWVLAADECGQAYKICVDIRSGKERMLMKEFTPYSMIYMIGDAAPAGWNIDSATEMKATDSPYIFTWNGNLNAGELKFTCDKQSDWDGAWFMPAAADQIPTGETEDMLFIDKSDDDFKAQYVDMAVNDIDRKWKITTAGTYTITLNQLEETISIVQQ